MESQDIGVGSGALFGVLVNSVIAWAEERGIIANSTPYAQAQKTVEEASETRDAARDLIAIDSHSTEPVLDEYFDGVGDTIVTLIIGLEIVNRRHGKRLNLVDCLQKAYDEIKDRRGYLNESGIFVKEVK